FERGHRHEPGGEPGNQGKSRGRPGRVKRRDRGENQTRRETTGERKQEARTGIPVLARKPCAPQDPRCRSRQETDDRPPRRDATAGEKTREEPRRAEARRVCSPDRNPDRSPGRHDVPRRRGPPGETPRRYMFKKPATAPTSTPTTSSHGAVPNRRS